MALSYKKLRAEIYSMYASFEQADWLLKTFR